MTGATGFVGGLLARRLLAEGAEVVTDPMGMRLFGLQPMGIDEALRRALANE